MTTISLGKVCDIVMGQAPPGNSYNNNDNGLPLIAGASDFGSQFPKPQKYTTSPTKISSKGDIILCIRATIGDINWSDRNYCLGRGVAGLKPNSDKLDSNYLWYWIKSNQRHIAHRGKGSTFKQISKEPIELLQIPEIPIAEQKRIAAILDKADAIRRKRRQALDLADQFLRSVFLNMFGDPVTNPKGWKEARISNIAANEKNAIKAGPFGSSLKKEIYTEHGYKIYGQEQVIRDDLTFGDYFISEEKYKELNACRIKEGDILISLVGTFGKISIVPRKFIKGIINPRLMKITLNPKKVLPVYFKHTITSKSFRARIENRSHGGTMSIVNVGIMKEIKIPVPPIELQEKFNDIVHKLENTRNKQTTYFNKSKGLFDSIVQRAFRGEL